MLKTGVTKLTILIKRAYWSCKETLTFYKVVVSKSVMYENLAEFKRHRKYDTYTEMTKFIAQQNTHMAMVTARITSLGNAKRVAHFIRFKSCSNNFFLSLVVEGLYIRYAAEIDFLSQWALSPMMMWSAAHAHEALFFLLSLLRYFHMLSVSSIISWGLAVARYRSTLYWWT